jgi:hypothetical protein
LYTYVTPSGVHQLDCYWRRSCAMLGVEFWPLSMECLPYLSVFIASNLRTDLAGMVCKACGSFQHTSEHCLFSAVSS